MTPREPYLALPGFAPGALGFALRTSLAMLLAYFLAFWSQLDSASSAGVCVAIVAQASPGMAMSKALYRIAGTVLGGVMALVLVSAFGQDRTMLLAAFTLWLGACTFVAALLRDFRSYGAVLCGYTVGIIAVSSIDAPSGVLLVTLDRVAAILLGVACVAVVNSLLARNVAYETLVAGLQHARTAMDALAARALAGEPAAGATASVDAAASILAQTSQASYAATELPDGAARSAGARAVIAALLAMLSAARALALGRGGAPMPVHVATPHDAFLTERASELGRQRQLAASAMQTLEQGDPAAPRVRLRVHYDAVAAALSATRTMVATGLGAWFCVVSGWPGVTGLLVQQAAFTALLGMQPNPSAAAAAMGWAFPLPALAAGVVGFVLLPATSGFGAFAVAVGACVFVLTLLGQHPRTARFAAGLLLYFALLLAPSNTESFDLAEFLNNALIQIVAILFMALAFRLIIPVSRKRRLARLADAIVGDLRRTMRGGRALDAAACQSLKYDRLVQAQTWLGRTTPARLAVFARLQAFAELDTALRRAWSGLDGLAPAGLAADARAALVQPDPVRLEAAARALLAQTGGDGAVAMRAVSGMYGAQLLLARQARALRHYGAMGG